VIFATFAFRRSSSPAGEGASAIFSHERSADESSVCQAEETRRIVHDLSAQRIFALAADSGEHSQRLPNIGGLVALAAIGLGGKMGVFD
jgi:hypothetical protein